MAIPHNSKCRYGERGAADAKPKAQIILDAAKVSAASGGNSEPKQGQRSQSVRGFCPRSTMRVPQPDIIEHFGNADAVPAAAGAVLKPSGGNYAVLPILSQVAGHLLLLKSSNYSRLVSKEILCVEIQIVLLNKFNTKQRCISAISHHVSTFLSIKQHANLCPRSLHINFRLSPYPAKSHRLVGCFNSKSYNTAHICHFVFRQYRIILSADTVSEVRQLLSQKRR